MSAEFITPAELAGRLNVSKNYVLNLMRTGRIPHLRLGSHALRISQTDAEAFIQASRVSGAA